jgi:hypothetical protein
MNIGYLDLNTNPSVILRIILPVQLNKEEGSQVMVCHVYGCFRVGVRLCMDMLVNYLISPIGWTDLMIVHYVHIYVTVIGLQPSMKIYETTSDCIHLVHGLETFCSSFIFHTSVGRFPVLTANEMVGAVA